MAARPLTVKVAGDAGAVAEAVHDLHLDAVAAIGQCHGAGNGLVGVGKVLDVLAIDGDDRFSADTPVRFSPWGS